MAEHTTPVSAKNVITEVQKRLPSSVSKDAIKKVVLENILTLALKGAITLHAFPIECVTKVSDKPKVSDLLRYQATYANWVTTQRSEKISIDIFNRVLMQYLDGNNDFDTIVEHMVTHVVNNDLVLHENKEKIVERDKIEEKLKILTKSSIDSFASKAILVA